MLPPDDSSGATAPKGYTVVKNKNSDANPRAQRQRTRPATPLSTPASAGARAQGRTRPGAPNAAATNQQAQDRTRHGASYIAAAQSNLQTGKPNSSTSKFEMQAPPYTIASPLGLPASRNIGKGPLAERVAATIPDRLFKLGRKSYHEWQEQRVAVPKDPLARLITPASWRIILDAIPGTGPVLDFAGDHGHVLEGTVPLPPATNLFDTDATVAAAGSAVRCFFGPPPDSKVRGGLRWVDWLAALLLVVARLPRGATLTILRPLPAGISHHGLYVGDPHLAWARFGREMTKVVLHRGVEASGWDTPMANTDLVAYTFVVDDSRVHGDRGPIQLREHFEAFDTGDVDMEDSDENADRIKFALAQTQSPLAFIVDSAMQPAIVAAAFRAARRHQGEEPSRGQGVMVTDLPERPSQLQHNAHQMKVTFFSPKAAADFLDWTTAREEFTAGEHQSFEDFETQVNRHAIPALKLAEEGPLFAVWPPNGAKGLEPVGAKMAALRHLGIYPTGLLPMPLGMFLVGTPGPLVQASLSTLRTAGWHAIDMGGRFDEAVLRETSKKAVRLTVAHMGAQPKWVDIANVPASLPVENVLALLEVAWLRVPVATIEASLQDRARRMVSYRVYLPDLPPSTTPLRWPVPEGIPMVLTGDLADPAALAVPEPPVPAISEGLAALAFSPHDTLRPAPIQTPAPSPVEEAPPILSLETAPDPKGIFKSMVTPQLLSAIQGELSNKGRNQIRWEDKGFEWTQFGRPLLPSTGLSPPSLGPLPFPVTSQTVKLLTPLGFAPTDTMGMATRSGVTASYMLGCMEAGAKGTLVLNTSTVDVGFELQGASPPQKGVLSAGKGQALWMGCEVGTVSWSIPDEIAGGGGLLMVQSVPTRAAKNPFLDGEKGMSPLTLLTRGFLASKWPPWESSTLQIGDNCPFGVELGSLQDTLKVDVSPVVELGSAGRRKFFGPTPSIVEDNLASYDTNTICPPPAIIQKALGGMGENVSIQLLLLETGEPTPLSIQHILEEGHLILMALSGGVDLQVEEEGSPTAKTTLQPGQWAYLPADLARRPAIPMVVGLGGKGGSPSHCILLVQVNSKTFKTIKRNAESMDQ